jgi:hypothetical protein
MARVSEKYTTAPMQATAPPHSFFFPPLVDTVPDNALSI